MTEDNSTRKVSDPSEKADTGTNSERSTKILTSIDFDENDTRWGTARFNRRNVLELRVQETEVRFVFMHDEAQQIAVGRADPDNGINPEVDLNKVNGLERGVSREHARVDMGENGTLVLIDLGSRNGTFLNGQQLTPQQGRVLRDGDDILFGQVPVRVSFMARTR
ncbi:MAG: FHA domain-containing protein [Chloroflexota bacterium]